MRCLHFRRRQRRAPPLWRCLHGTHDRARTAANRHSVEAPGLHATARWQRHQLQRCVHDVLAGGRDHRCSSCEPLDAAPSLRAKGLAERCSIPNWGSSCKCRWAPSQDAKVQSGTIVSVNKITLLRNDLTNSLSHHGILNRNTHSNNTIKTHPKTAL